MVHRDLAARNVLLCDNLVAKISDFGLCCTTDETLIHKGNLAQKLPIKWLALEALTDRIFSEKSDIWSFGILVYEVFTFGSIPYANMNNDEMLVFLQAGNRLERPNNVCDELYEIMKSCWNKYMGLRPNFLELEERFENLNDFPKSTRL
uniref:Protein kinase domain-containing protein n=1 Tax=Acrobeloides nanus TaxID=290746 RepID=A0A914ER02_9BILA